MAEFNAFLPALAGKLFVAFVVRRFAQGGSLFGQQGYASPMAGTSWGWPQYLAAVVAAQFGGKLFAKIGISSREFRRGAYDLILTKLVWTEGIARSQWMAQTFGRADGQVMYDPSSGQSWLGEGGRYVAMQGMGDALVQQGPLDGLVEATPLDGTGTSGYGHLMDPESPAEAIRQGKYSGAGYTDAYQAAYGYQ